MLFGNNLMSIIYMIPILLLSLSIHEYAHAYVAYKLGDRSQKYQGRLTLDPLKHIDILGFISIILVGFGWGKPVCVDDSNFKDRNKGSMLVSIAGPASNLVLAVVFTLILKVLYLTGVVPNIVSTSIGGTIFGMFVMSIQFNVIFAVFNMLPFPPFDGSKVLMYFLPYRWKEYMYKFEKYSFYVILVLYITGLYQYIINPFINGIMYLLELLLNL
ncbi:MAG: site-2 protease family protein [Clostridia bacterium]